MKFSEAMGSLGTPLLGTLLVIIIVVLYLIFTQLQAIAQRPAEAPVVPPVQAPSVPAPTAQQPAEEGPSCTGAWSCKDASILGYRNADCSWSDEKQCEFGCLNGTCKADPCAGIACNDTCSGDSRQYNGKCTDGKCSYSSLECAHGCAAGVCKADPCAGVLCSSYCDANIKRYNGRCVQGQCVYESQVCEYGCQGGACSLLTCSASFDKSRICTGESVVGTIRGAPNDICKFLSSTNNVDWQVSGTIILDETGLYATEASGFIPGVFYAYGLCTKCTTNTASVTIEACAPPEPVGCTAKCQSAGYVNGYEGTCNKPYLYEGETQVGSCCCYREEIPAGHRCYDTDFGNDPEVFGTCYDEAHPGGIADYCGGPGLADNWVGENFCSMGTCMGVSELCPLTTEHCVGGQCVPH